MAPKKRDFGNIRRLPSGRFQARYTGPDGTVIKAPRTFSTRRDADRWVSTELADLTRGTWRDPGAGSETLSEYATSWLATHHELRPRTRELDERLAHRFITNAIPIGGSLGLGETPLRQITPTMVRHWRSWVLHESRAGSLAKKPAAVEGSPKWNRALRAWAAREGLNVKPTGRIPVEAMTRWEGAGRPQLLSPPRITGHEGEAQTAQAYRLLHTILQAAVSEGLLTVNPCQVKSGSTAKAPDRKPATPEEVAAIAVATPERYRAAVLIGAWGGLRAGEIFALDRASVDLQAGCVTVRRSVAYLNGKGFHFGEPKSDKGYRTVCLPSTMMDAVSRHMDRFTGPKGDDLLFTTSSGRPVPSSRRTAWFRRAAEGAGRDDLRFHDLRHTGATLAAQTGATIADLQQRFGHSTARASLIYQHTSLAADRRIAERLETLSHVS